MWGRLFFQLFRAVRADIVHCALVHRLSIQGGKPILVRSLAAFPTKNKDRHSLSENAPIVICGAVARFLRARISRGRVAFLYESVALKEGVYACHSLSPMRGSHSKAKHFLYLASAASSPPRRKRWYLSQVLVEPSVHCESNVSSRTP